MDNLQFVIAQGATPQIRLPLPFDFPESGGKAFATFSQADKNVLEYGLNGTATPAIAGTGTLTVSNDNAAVLVLSMEQADTLALKAGDAELQLRVLAGAKAYTFPPLIGAVMPAKKQGVIS